MASPTMKDVHQNVALSNISIAYRNQDYIADTICPLVPVTKFSDSFYKWTKDYWFRSYVERRAPGDTYPEGDTKLETDTYTCKLYHLAKAVADEDRSNQDAAVDLDTAAAEWLADQFQLDREILVSAAFFAGSVWTAVDSTLSGTSRWDDYDASNPLTQVQAMKQAIKVGTGQKMNALVIGEEVFHTLQEHPLLIDKFKYTEGGILSEDQVRQALIVDKLIVGGAIQNSAVDGATFAGAYLWGKSALGLHMVDSPGLLKPAAAYTFNWSDVGGSGFPVPISTLRDDMRDRDLHRGKAAFTHKITGSDLGAYYGTVIS